MWKDSTEVLRTKRVSHLNFVRRQGWVQQQIQGSEEVAIEGLTARSVLVERRPKGKTPKIPLPQINFSLCNWRRKLLMTQKNSLMNQTLI